jgi:recombination protein RecT
MADNLPAATKQPSAIAVFQSDIDVRGDMFRNALPAHIPYERFRRVALRAVQKNPDLLKADRASVINACIDAANDGLLPDGREGAMVMFGPKAQWMPMTFGILKKIRNSGGLKSIMAHVVYEGDAFRYWVDEGGEHVLYEASDAPDKTTVRRVFAMAITTDGGVYIEVMDKEDIEKVRAVSKAKNNGPWVSWWEEMAKKTVIRRLSKRLPMSTDLDDLIRRDDALYDLNGASDGKRQVERPATLSGRLDALAGAPAIEHDPQTGEIKDTENGQATSSQPDRQPAGEGAQLPAGDLIEKARAAGGEAYRKNMSRRAVPAGLSEPEKDAWLEGFGAEADKGEAQ